MPIIVRRAVRSGIAISAVAASCLSKGHSKKTCKTSILRRSIRQLQQNLAGGDEADGDSLGMRQVMEKWQRFTVASLVAVVFLWLLSLPLIQFTWTVIETWVQFHLDKGEPFSIGRWLDATTLALALAGPIVLLLSAFGVLAAIRSEWPRWPVLAVPLGFIVALYAMVCIPNVPLWHSELFGNSNHLGSLEHRLEGWDRIHGRFPLTRAEVDSVLGGVATEPGPYCQRGKRLDYQIELILNQTAPYHTSPQQPGIVYYAVIQLDGNSG